MILVADSGSTKTNWLLSTAPEKLMETIGFNPFFHTSEAIYEQLVLSEDLGRIRTNVSQVYFYGAGCSSADRMAIVRQSLQNFFTEAEIHVDHDLMAAALATYDGRKCISCILGTGSNACLYDGSQIDKAVTRGFGYILGDEASGSYFGRRLLSAFLYHELPDATYQLMLQNYGLTKENILWSVYNESHANVFMAKFAKVLTLSPDRDYIEPMVSEGFREFFRHNVICFDGYASYPVHFVGSIAFHFRPLLQKVAEEFGCELGAVNRQPVHKLLEWHQNASVQAAKK
jgi:N-acetylglucosamine kinase-like BadF-type ATPase